MADLTDIITSRVRVKLINLFLSDDTELYHVRGITRKTDEEINAVRRELERLQQCGFRKGWVFGRFQDAGFEVQGDDNDGIAQLEIVTDPFSGSLSKEYCRMVQEVEKYTREIAVKYRTYKYSPVARDLDLVLPMKHQSVKSVKKRITEMSTQPIVKEEEKDEIGCFFGPIPFIPSSTTYMFVFDVPMDAEMTPDATPQATIAVPIDRLSALLDFFSYETGLSERVIGLFTNKLDLFYNAKKYLREIPMVKYLGNKKGEDLLYAAYRLNAFPRTKGFLRLLSIYVESPRLVGHSRKYGKLPYPKARIGPLLLRHNFGVIYKRLVETEFLQFVNDFRRFLPDDLLTTLEWLVLLMSQRIVPSELEPGENDREFTQAKDLVEPEGDVYDPPMARMFPYGYAFHEENYRVVYHGPLVRTWLRGILDGQDLLSDEDAGTFDHFEAMGILREPDSIPKYCKECALRIEFRNLRLGFWPSTLGKGAMKQSHWETIAYFFNYLENDLLLSEKELYNLTMEPRDVAKVVKVAKSQCNKLLERNI